MFSMNLKGFYVVTFPGCLLLSEGQVLQVYFPRGFYIWNIAQCHNYFCKFETSMHC